MANSTDESVQNIGNIVENSTITTENPHLIDDGFPEDLFTRGQLQSGGIFLHLLGIIYMSGGWLILYKEYFIPSLFAIVQKFSCTEDVAGGAVLAIGILLPELIQHIITIFFAFDDVNFGGMVGSISFNLLIYLGIAGCAGSSLKLSGWSIGRDFGYQFLMVIILVAFMIDSSLAIYECILLILFYGIYCILLKFHGKIKKSRCCKKEPIPEISLDNPDLNPELSGNHEESTKIESFTNTILNEDPLTLKLNDKESMKEKILFILWFPLIAIFWLSMNWLDVRKKEKRNFFAINYILSIIIMRFLAYLIVWWITIFGNVVALPAEITGLTFFAFAIHVPILYFIAKAAKHGCGDLILSMTSGINIFNMTIGLGLPYFIQSIAYSIDVPAKSQGIICSTIIVILILIAIVSFLACFRGKLSKVIGIIYIVIYVLFVAISISFTYGFVQCPV